MYARGHDNKFIPDFKVVKYIQLYEYQIEANLLVFTDRATGTAVLGVRARYREVPDTEVPIEKVPLHFKRYGRTWVLRPRAETGMTWDSY